MTPSSDITVITADQVSDHLPMGTAIAALEDALRSGLDPQDSPARTSVPLEQGSFLLMPGEHGAYAGVKVLTVAPGNPARGLPKIQGNYLLFDAGTLRPLALIDGEVLTAVRTPAVSALAVDRLAPAGASSLLVFGTGPQALYHVRAVAAVRNLTTVTVVGRSEAKTEALLGRLRAEGHDARRGTTADVAEAELITCCTSAREPLFDGALVRENAVVVAMGSHEADAREVDDALLIRSTVYVEDVETALREAGDVIIGIEHGAITSEDLHDLSSLVRSGPRTRSGPAFFKSVGMGWEDLITARAAYENIAPARG
ncbi:ornithine cyclodeaminase family protein [Kocuria sp. M1N1S27]|uniref:ornithine cyclodeaminase family protein n=1 Tax=Kocuria kalidii TaxID=3376283 RepID=UPI0037894F6F